MEQTVVSTVIHHDSKQPLDDAVTKRLRDETQKIIDALVSPAYVAALRAVKAAPVQSRLQEASTRLTPEALRKQGVKLPENMRISSRYFEAGMPRPLSLGDGAGKDKKNTLLEILKKEPTLLDELRASKSPAFDALLMSDEFGASGMEGLTMAAFGGCTCGGTPVTIPPFTTTACAGAGVHLM